MRTYEHPISVAAAARRADVTHSAVYGWIKTGQLEAQRVADHWIVDGDDLDRFLAEREQPGDHQAA